jgi:hypothetical protein
MRQRSAGECISLPASQKFNTLLVEEFSNTLAPQDDRLQRQCNELFSCGYSFDICQGKIDSSNYFSADISIHYLILWTLIGRLEKKV